MKLVVLALALFASSADAANSQDISYMCATRKTVSPSDLFDHPPMALIFRVALSSNLFWQRARSSLLPPPA